MTCALPMIVPQPINNRRNRKPSGQKAPLQPKEVWAIRVRLQLAGRIRDLALFNLAIDSKLRGCDLVRLKVADIAQMGEAQSCRAGQHGAEDAPPFSAECRLTPGWRT